MKTPYQKQTTMQIVKTIKPHQDYYYHEPYLLLNGTESFVDDIICHLRHSGISVEYNAKPKYPCRNGLKYDWFVKLTDSPPISRVFDFINTYNNQIITGKAIQLENQEELKRRYIELQSELSTLQEQASGHSQISSSQVIKIESLTAELKLFEDENKELVDKIMSQDITLNEVSEGRDLLHFDLQNAETRILALESELQEAQNTSRNIQNAPDKRGLESLFKALWKEVVFLKNSIALIEMECDYNLVMPKLRGIIDQNLQGKPVKGASGWHEERFSTGKGHDGRIYFTYQIGQKSRKIIVSRKDLQKVDFDYIKACKLTA